MTSDDSRGEVEKPDSLGSSPPSVRLQEVLSALLRGGSSSLPGDQETARVEKGESIGRYGVVEEIARGGMGAVLKVRDGDLGRDLAMKLVLEKAQAEPGSDPTPSKRISRFLEEAQITGQLEHPGIVPIHELGVDDKGGMYFTMPLVRGRTLDVIFEKVRTGEEGWTLTRALGVILKVCEAMAFAHTKGVIHRDIKPANTMVGRFGETYVMDWGLAKVLGEDDVDRPKPDLASSTATIIHTFRRDQGDVDPMSTLMTLEGDVVGTPAYMPPEQARGKVEEMGPHSDVYSVGAMLYHLLTDEVPYKSKTERASPHSILQWVIDGPPTPITKLARDVPGELVAICEKAMARDPKDRYAGMLEMADDIQAYIEGRVVHAYETGAVAEFKKWVVRNKGMAASIAVAALLAISGLVTVSLVQASAAERLMNANADLLRTNAELETANRDKDLAREDAVANAQLASAERKEALWQSYVANVRAASASLNVGASTDSLNRLGNCEEEHRGWEWNHLFLRASLTLMAMEHEAFVFSIAYSPDGRRIAGGSGVVDTTGDRIFKVKTWDARTGAPLQSLEGHNDTVTCLAFDSEGTRLVSGSRDNSLRAWDVLTGDEIAVLPSLDGDVMGVSFLADGQVLFGTYGGQLGIWNPDAGEITFEQQLSTGIRSLALAPDGRHVAAGLRDVTVAIFDLERRETVRTFRAHGDYPPRPSYFLDDGVTCVAFSPDGERLVAGSTDMDLRLWKWRDGEMITRLRGHDRAPSAVAFSPDGKWIFSAGYDTTVRSWNAATGEMIEVLIGHEAPTTCLAFSPSGHRIVSGGMDSFVRVWDGQPGSAAMVIEGGTSSDGLFGYQIEFDPSGRQIAWWPTRRTLRISDTWTGETLFEFPRTQGNLRGMAYHPGGGRLYTAADGDALRAWDTRTGALLEVIGEPLPSMGVVVFSHDTKLFAASQNQPDMQVVVRSSDNSEVVSRIAGHKAPISAMEFTRDGKHLLTGSLDTFIRYYVVETGELVHEIETGFMAGDFAIYPDNRRALSITYDDWERGITIWDLETGREIDTILGHTVAAFMDLSPDGTRILTGNWDNTLSVWDAERGEILSLQGHTSFINQVAFSPDGKRVASMAMPGILIVWESVPLAERAEERAKVGVRRRLEPEARALVEELLADHVIVADVVDYLLSDSSLDEDLRRSAIGVARRRPDDPAALAAQSFALACDTEATEDERAKSLRWARAAANYAPSVADCQMALGAALYRAERFEEASRVWSRAEEIASSRVGGRPRASAFAAMIHDRAGQTDRSLSALTRMRSEMRFLDPGRDAEVLESAQELLREAEALVFGSD